MVLIINQFVIISIHALCEEGDPRPQRLRGHQRAISIHALCEEGDETDDLNEAIGILFLSTPSARRATSQSSRTTAAMDTFLSTPSARRAT